MSELPIGYDDVEAAAGRIAGMAVRTPLLRSSALDKIAGAALVIKPEPLQRTGSFKFRGALNAIRARRPPAVVAYSSGNHAQGVALAARLTNIPATIVMPADAPRIKLENTQALGAEVVPYDRASEDRERIGAEIAARTGALLVRPYDDPLVMAGQGTVGLELATDAAAVGMAIDTALVCCGGGGLIAGCATALTHHLPTVEVLSVEPEGFDDTALSLRAGERVGHAAGARSICDALLAPTPGELTFAVNRRLLAGGLAVSDEEVRETMRLAFRHLKLVIEPGGAVALAAALFRKRDWGGRTLGIVVSGGNVDPEAYAAIIGRPGPLRPVG